MFADGLPASIERADGATRDAALQRPDKVHRECAVAGRLLAGFASCPWCGSSQRSAFKAHGDWRVMCSRCRGYFDGEHDHAPPALAASSVERRSARPMSEARKAAILERLGIQPLQPFTGPSSGFEPYLGPVENPGVRPSASQIAAARWLAGQV
jgi:hypothetical protein